MTQVTENMPRHSHCDTRRLRIHQTGLSLVEVFVALLVLSVGLIALAKLQVDLVRSGSDGRARTTAIAIAEQKLEDLRTFATKTAALTWSVTTNPMAWSYIANNQGGRVAQGVITRSGVDYTLSWTSTVAATAGPGGTYQSRYKPVTVTVQWTNPNDTVQLSQSVQLRASIPDTPPGVTALASQVLVPSPGPELIYAPGAAPEVISVPIDQGTTRRETNKPIPTVKSSADSTTVSFDVVNYNASTDAITRREEFVTISCSCTFNGTGAGRTPAKVVLVGNTLRDQPGQYVVSGKTIGSPASSQQPPLCEICCRDHHDFGDGNRYKPTDTVDHAHYRKSNLTQAVTSGDYDEVCRLKRINGVFQVFEDWQLRALTVMPKADLLPGATPNPSYTTAVENFVRSYAAKVAVNQTPPTSLTFSPSAVSVGNGTSQLLARAIYVDNMPANLLAKVKGMLDTDPNDPAALSFIPFYEVHLTKLADWSVYPDLTKVTVTSDPIQNDALGLVNTLYSRGFVQPQANATAGTAKIIASAKNYNSGVTGTDPINITENVIHPKTAVIVGNGNNAVTYYYSGTRPVDEVTPATAQHKDGSMDVTVVASAGNIIVSGGIKKAKGSNAIVAANIRAPSVSGVDCIATNASGQTIETFTCTVTPGPTGWSGTIHFSSSSNYVFCLNDNGQDAKTTGQNQVPAIQCTALANGDWTPSVPLTAAYTLNVWVSTPVP